MPGPGAPRAPRRAAQSRHSLRRRAAVRGGRYGVTRASAGALPGIRVDEDGAGPARGEVAPAPVNQDLEPITKTDQIDDVHAQPQQPREEPVELQRIPAGASGGWPQWQLGHRVTSAEHGHDPLVAVAEGP